MNCQNSWNSASGSTSAARYFGTSISILERRSWYAVLSSSSSNHDSTGICDKRGGTGGALGSARVRLPVCLVRAMIK
ncbi:hypothetical protein PIB30_111840, partial [Stylosanthes scabra]|nr:hypothetical protein [Stylosanthes scabra]